MTRRGAPHPVPPRRPAAAAWLSLSLSLSLTAALLLACLACLTASPTPTAAKTVTGAFQLEAGDLYRGPEVELAKFSFVVGRGRIAGKFRYRDPHTWMTSPALYLFRDESWPDYHRAPACDDKMNFAFKAIPIGEVTRSHTDVLHRGLDQATKTDLQHLPDGMIEWTFEWEFETTERTRGWFLIAADCALEQFNAKVSPMSYEVSLFNPGNTHLPADEYGLPKLYLFVFVGLCLVMGFSIYSIVSRRFDSGAAMGTDGVVDKSSASSSSSSGIHLVVWLMLFADATLLLAILCELLHLWYYKDNGRGVFVFDLLSEMLDGLSQLTVAFVLICLASGWTLVHVEADAVRTNSVGSLLRNPKNLVRGPNLGIFAVLLVVVATFALQVLNKMSDEDFSKFHDYESRAGTMLVLLHFLLGVFFVVSLLVTLRSEAKRSGTAATSGSKDKLVIFLRRLLLFGGLWFLIFPLLVLVAGTLEHYNRHRFVSGGVLLVQTTCAVLMTHQFVSNKSTYAKLSQLADVGVLPGAGGLVKPVKVSRD